MPRVTLDIVITPKSGVGAQTRNATVSPGATGKLTTRTAGSLNSSVYHSDHAHHSTDWANTRAAMPACSSSPGNWPSMPIQKPTVSLCKVSFAGSHLRTSGTTHEADTNEAGLE